MSTAKRLHYGYSDYLASLEMSELKLEYCDGVIYAMAGGTRAHAQLSAAVIVALHRVLPKSCLASTSDMKVRIEASDLSTFPDVSVVCGEPIMSSIDANALSNPTLLVEVTSKGTEDYDRGDKLSHYKQLPSLRVVLFVSHRKRSITRVQRTEGGWEEREFRAGEVVSVESPQLSFTVDEVYDGIVLDPQ
ncbi:MAG: Uma2 family endonuclease [Archangium sp.]|nr:Uma2 family endonuclease [Archangium sp.]MDP3569692.1 Uma2 family endonuclease [Archangium sp.]